MPPAPYTARTAPALQPPVPLTARPAIRQVGPRPAPASAAASASPSTRSRSGTATICTATCRCSRATTSWSRPPRRSSPQSTMRSRGPKRLICGMSSRATSRTRVVEARRCAAVRDRAAAADACAPAEAAHAPVQAERGPAVLGRAGSLTPPLLTDSIYPRPLQEAPAEALKFKGTRYPDFGRLEVGRGSWHFRETWRLPCPQPSRIVFPTLTLCALLDCDPSRYGFLIPDDRDSPRSADASRR